MSSHRTQVEAIFGTGPGSSSQGSSSAPTCSLCSRALAPGDLTTTLTWWAAGSGDHPVVPDGRHAHMECFLRDLRFWVQVEVTPPRLSVESVTKKLKRCRRHWDLFMSNEKNALSNFEALVASGRELTPRQQVWLAQMAAKAKAAANAQHDVASRGKGGSRTPPTT